MIRNLILPLVQSRISLYSRVGITENRASRSTLEYPIGFWSFFCREPDKLNTIALVVGSSETEEVMSRLWIENVHLFVGVRRASMYESCLKSEPDRRIGIPLTV